MNIIFHFTSLRCPYCFTNSVCANFGCRALLPLIFVLLYVPHLIEMFLQVVTWRLNDLFVVFKNTLDIVFAWCHCGVHASFLIHINFCSYTRCCKVSTVVIIHMWLHCTEAPHNHMENDFPDSKAVTKSIVTMCAAVDIELMTLHLQK